MSVNFGPASMLSRRTRSPPLPDLRRPLRGAPLEHRPARAAGGRGGIVTAADAFFLRTALSRGEDSTSNSPGQPEAERVVPDARRVAVAERHAQERWIVVPGTAADDAATAILGLNGASIRRCIAVIADIAIFDP